MKQEEKIKNNKLYLGFDNGTTASVGIVKQNCTPSLFSIPTKKELDYTKKKSYISRIDTKILYSIIEKKVADNERHNCLAGLERPMINPGRFKATISAARAFEAVVIVLEMLGIPIVFLDSSEWQKELLPSGLSGKELKKGSLDIGNRLFPMYLDFKHPDRDGLLIAEYLKRNNL